MKKKKKMQNLKENRLLVSIKVVGSAGPIRFVVKEDETVTNVIDITLRCYARQGRLPMFSSHFTSSFLLYTSYSPDQREIQFFESVVFCIYILQMMITCMLLCPKLHSTNKKLFKEAQYINVIALCIYCSIESMHKNRVDVVHELYTV